MKNLSVCLSKVSTFNSKTFLDKKKNRIIMPFNIFFSIKGYNALTEDH